MRISIPIVLVLAALVAFGNTGCAKTETDNGVTRTAGRMMAAVGDRREGSRVFEQNCATCHGATGREGGVGPSLRDEHTRKNYDATIAWIKHPLPPMPALYPSPLSEKAVDDVAAYVQSL